jgi:hypothetical protein
VTLIKDAQDDMRDGYHSGAPGVLASTLAWSAAAASVVLLSPQQAVWVLFFGGMFIFPVGVVIGKVLGARGSHTKGNPLASLAAANTVWMLLCFPLAFAAQMQKIEWFFPAVLLIIGGRYLTFAVMYGMRVYWLLGFALAAVGLAVGYLAVAPIMSAAAGAGIELMFAAVLFVLHGRWAGGRPAQAAG